jgi:N-formylmaleamate deformylase
MARRAPRRWGVLAVTLGLAACGASTPPASDPPRNDDGGGPFSRARGFEPVAFGVEVHGEGRPVILIPGLGCPGDVWTTTVEHLGEGYQTHVLTLSGFAGRPAIDEPLSAAVRRDLTRYIRSRRLRHPVIVGHSMGGFIAYWIATYHPELVGPVIVVDAGPALSGDLEEARLLRSKWRRVADDEFAKLTRAKFRSMSRKKPPELEPVVAKVALSDRRAFADAIYELITTDLTAQVRDIQAPVLILAADGYFQHRIRKQVQTIPDHEMIVFAGAGHFVMFDAPERYFAAIDRFLAAHPADD